MAPLVSAADKIHWYMSNLTSRIVAESGIPSDRYHLGKLILQSLKDAPDFVLQVDASTGKSENFKSALQRSVQCAHSLKKMGLRRGDVIAIIASNYLEVAILFYSALYLGIGVAVIDPILKDLEIQEMLQVNRAKVIFSDNKKVPNVKEALKKIDLKANIISFVDGSDVKSFTEFIEEFCDVDPYMFQPTNFDPEETIATLVPTSGTTGLPRVVATTHMNYLPSIPRFWGIVRKVPTPFDSCLLSSPVQALSGACIHISAPILRCTKIQTSALYSVEHIIDVINKYRPQATVITPAAMFSLLNPGIEKKADFTCFKLIGIGGTAVPQQLFNDLKKLSPNTLLMHRFGASEITGAVFNEEQRCNIVTGSLGRPVNTYDVKLVDPDTSKDLIEPYVRGELWIKGPSVSKGYHNNPSETKAAFVDGWFRTGDIFYRDEQYMFYYVDRLKLLLKYRTYHVSPAELERVILDHPGVVDVVVVGVPDLECCDLPAACIVPDPDDPPTAQDIKDFVKEKLSDAKQLRGGVIFLDKFPLTVTSKVDRQKLKAMAIVAKRE